MGIVIVVQIINALLLIGGNRRFRIIYFYSAQIKQSSKHNIWLGQNK